MTDNAPAATINGISGGVTQIDALIDGVVRQTMTVTVIGGAVRGTVTQSTAAVAVRARPGPRSSTSRSSRRLKMSRSTCTGPDTRLKATTLA